MKNIWHGEKTENSLWCAADSKLEKQAMSDKAFIATCEMEIKSNGIIMTK